MASASADSFWHDRSTDPGCASFDRNGCVFDWSGCPARKEMISGPTDSRGSSPYPDPILGLDRVDGSYDSVVVYDVDSIQREQVLAALKVVGGPALHLRSA